MTFRRSQSLLLVLATAIAGAASAMSSYPARIPNGAVNSCLNCHLSAGGGGTRNAFAGNSWLGIVDLDSDGDTQSNGQELGDPCGVWQQGQTPGRTTNISLPGDPGSISATPDQPACPLPDAGAPADAASAVDSASAPDGASAVDSAAPLDATTAPDASAGDVATCTPVCLDRTRLYACTSSGQHLEQPCPTGTECKDGACAPGTSLFDGGQGDGGADAGCGCQAGLAVDRTAAALALVAVWLARRRRRSRGAAVGARDG